MPSGSPWLGNPVLIGSRNPLARARDAADSVTALADGTSRSRARLNEEVCIESDVVFVTPSPTRDTNQLWSPIVIDFRRRLWSTWLFLWSLAEVGLEQ